MRVSVRIVRLLIALAAPAFVPCGVVSALGEEEAAMVGPDPVPQELVDQIPGATVSPRGIVTCELFELKIASDDDGVPHVALTVWNNMDLHGCPEDWLSRIDRTKYHVGGPRWRTQDSFLVRTDAEGGLVLGGQDDAASVVETSANPPAEVPPGLGLPMVDAATVLLMPVATLEENMGIANITSIDELPFPVQQTILARASGSQGEDAGYNVLKIDRVFKTLFRFGKGLPVYTLRDETTGCTYAMKFRSAELDPALADVALLMDLGSRYQKLPDHLTYQVLTYETDRFVVDTDNVQYVLTDEFSNSFDLFRCDGVDNGEADLEMEGLSSAGKKTTVAGMLGLFLSVGLSIFAL